MLASFLAMSAENDSAYEKDASVEPAHVRVYPKHAKMNTRLPRENEVRIRPPGPADHEGPTYDEVLHEETRGEEPSSA